MENKNQNINRRNYLELILGGAILPSLSLSEERNFNPKLKGWTIQDLSNKQNVRGFVYIPTVWGQQLRSPDFQDQNFYDFLFITNYPWINMALPTRASNIGLVEAVNKYTNINACSGKHLFLSSSHLIQYPFVYIATDKAFELTKTERDNFENYLRNGGFALLESLESEYNFYFTKEGEYSPAEASLKQMIRDVLKEDARFSPIPILHPLYHCFFDFDAPPQGTEINNYTTQSPIYSGIDPRTVKMPKPRPYLEGIFLDDRLVAVYSGKGYGQKWKDISNNEPQQKMAVNFVIFALTQKGGITQKDKY